MQRIMTFENEWCRGCRRLHKQSEFNCIPRLKLLVAVCRSFSVKFFQAELTGHASFSTFSLVLLLFLLDNIGTSGGKEGNRFVEPLFQTLKNLCQRECPCEIDWKGLQPDILPGSFSRSASFSKPLVHASRTPLGDEWSNLSFSTSKHLRSTAKKRSKWWTFKSLTWTR